MNCMNGVFLWNHLEVVLMQNIGFKNNLTLRSLFDGIVVFPLAVSRYGI